MKPLTYTLVVNGPQYGTQSARNAYLFAKALIEKGHILKSVFFIKTVCLMARQRMYQLMMSLTCYKVGNLLLNPIKYNLKLVLQQRCAVVL